MKILINYALFYLYYIEQMVGLHVCLGTACTSGVDRGWKSAWDSLGLEVPSDVSHHVGAGNHTLLF